MFNNIQFNVITSIFIHRIGKNLQSKKKKHEKNTTKNKIRQKKKKYLLLTINRKNISHYC